MKENKFGISGNVLKMIALVTMLIDHVGAVIVQRTRVFPEFSGEDWIWLNQSYDLLRSVGRVAFPIFCFLLVEGFLHTKSAGKYLTRMLVFAVISEIPFNLAITGGIQSTAYQNVYWELALGLAVLMIFRFFEEKKFHYILQVIARLLVVTVAMGAAESLNLDYGLYGILSIAILYICRTNRLVQALAGGLSFCWEIPAPLAFVPVAFYNGKRGRGLKYAFYVFYPAHLLILYEIAIAIGCPY